MLQRFLLVLIPVFFFAPLSSVILSPVLAGAALMHTRPKLSNITYPLCVAALFIGYATLSTLWSIDPSRSISRAARLWLEIGICACLLSAISDLAAGEAKQLLKWSIRVFLGCLFLACVDNLLAGVLSAPFRNSELEHFYSRSNSLVVMLGPLAIFTSFVLGHKKTTAAGAVLVVLFTFQGYASTPAVALTLALLAAGGVALFPWLRYAFFIVIILVCTTGPFLFGTLIEREDFCQWTRTSDASLYHRGVIWQFTTQKAWERPVFGWGLESARSLDGGQNSAETPFCPKPEKWGTATAERLPLHPHNGILHIWVELGTVGLILFLALALSTLSTAYQHYKRPVSHAIITASAVAYFVITLLSYGVWQGWWINSLIITIAAVHLAVRGLERFPDSDIR